MSLLSKYSLRVSLIMGFLICAVLTGLSGGGGIFSLLQVNRQMDDTAIQVRTNIGEQNKQIRQLAVLRNSINRISQSEAKTDLENIKKDLAGFETDFSGAPDTVIQMIAAINSLAEYKESRVLAFTTLSRLMAECIQALETITRYTIESVDTSIADSIASIETETQSIRTRFGALLTSPPKVGETQMNMETVLARSGINDMMDDLMMVSEMSISSVRAAMAVQSMSNRQLVLIKDIFNADNKPDMDRTAEEILMLKGHVNSEIVELPEDDTTPKIVTHLDLLAQLFDQIIETKETDILAADTLEQKTQDLQERINQVEAGMIEKGKALTQTLNAAMDRNSKTIKTWQTVQAGFVLSAVLLAVGIGFFLSVSITRPLYEIIEGLNQSATQVESASRRMSDTGRSLAEGSTEQAAAIEQTSASMEEISSMTQENTRSAQQADDLMHQASTIVENANRSVARINTSMAEIEAAGKETVGIVKTIDEIAFQTNLLALNAAVEAARAGEAGAGFAVVADEVRNLAIRAADAAQNTAELIEGTVQKVDTGKKIGNEAGQAFEDVRKSTGSAADLVTGIATASKEQSQGIRQINRAISQMDGIIQQNTRYSDESVEASRQLRSEAEQLKTYVDRLVAMVKGRNTGKRTGPHLIPEKI